MGFFQSIMELFGLRKKKILDSSSKAAIPVQPVPRLAEKALPKNSLLEEKFDSPSSSSSRKKFAFGKNKPVLKRAKQKSVNPLQFEVEQILTAALSLKKKIEARKRKKHSKSKKKKPKKLSKKQQRRLLIKELKETLTPLSPEVLNKMKNKVSRANPLTAVEIQRLRFNLNSGLAAKNPEEAEIRTEELDRIRKTLLEKPAASITEKELRTEELERIRKSLAEPGGNGRDRPFQSAETQSQASQNNFQAIPKSQSLQQQDSMPSVRQQNSQPQFSGIQGTVVQVPEGASVFIGSQPPQVQQAVQQKKSEESQLSIDDDISATERLLKALEQDYLKRRISEQEYRQRVLDLNQRLRELKIKKKIQGEKPVEIKLPDSEKPLEDPEQKIPAPAPASKPLRSKFQFSRPSVHYAVPQGNDSLTPEMQKFLQERLGKSDDAKLSELEANVQKLMKKYNLSESEAEEKIAKIDSPKVLQSFDKLVDLIELEQRTQKLMQEQLQIAKDRSPKQEEKSEFGSGFEAGVPKKKIEEVKAIVVELQKHRIVTDFDKLLELVQSKGKVSESDAFKELKISKDKLKDCINVLEQNNLVRVEFPPIGTSVIFDVNYIPPVKLSKQEKNEKK
ncbi:MAG: hypothetical protein Q7R70_03145 [Candidatus Diapherotrites archaeon]|nr:hypothetical protein [Candidatus Diapherotrites archaeon]